MAALDPVLLHALRGIVRIEVEHVVRRRFRVLFLVEAALGLLFSVVLVPTLIVAAIVMGVVDEVPAPTLESLGRRMWVRWRETRVALVDAYGRAVAAAAVKIESLEAGDRLMGQVLARANDGKLAVVERVEGGVVAATWFGGQPLMRGPEAIDEARAWRVLQHEGFSLIDDGRGRCVISVTHPLGRRAGAFVALGLLLPLGVWTSVGRDRLAALWAACQGQATRVCFEIDVDGVSYRKTRGPEVLDQVRIDRSDLLAVGHPLVLMPAPLAAVRGPFLRLHSPTSAVLLDVPYGPQVTEAIRDAIVGAAHRLWSGLSQSGAPAHCPYCATLYPYAPGSDCPSCGAAPSALHGLARRAA